MGAIKIFYSYSHVDEDLREQLEIHLSTLRKPGRIIDWHDRKITAGKDWAKEISTNLNEAHIILLLISPNFMASDYCNDIEVKRAMERHVEGKARVIPVIIRAVYWEHAQFGKLECLPKNRKPVHSWSDRDEAFTEVIKGIVEVIDEIEKPRSAIQANVVQTANAPENTFGSNQLYDSLLRLDFKEQVKQFRAFIEGEHHVGSFLIHGEPEHGQRWLLHRLLKMVSYNSNEKVFPFSFKRLGGGRGIDALWRDLGNWSGPKNCQSSQKIVEQVHNLWQTQSLILLLRNIHIIDEQYIKRFLQDFWLPLVERTELFPGTSNNNYLLLFLIDDEKPIDSWSITLAENLDTTWNAHIPLKLKRLTFFSEDALSLWKEHEVATLPEKLIVSDILKDSEGGLPELVFDRICAMCGYNWYERIDTWIKY